MSRRSLPPDSWAPVARAARALASPLQRVLAVEAASGIVLLVATVAALVWANTDHASYEALWHAEIGFDAGPWSFSRPLHFWINDGLMTIFFFVVGLEIRREIFEGELASLRQAALPLAAAVGGMLVPALIYVAFNAGRSTSAGWAIPMATDIAFAVGILTLLGSRVPNVLRVLLLALAVIDDIGAIVVIAAFYSAGIDVEALLVVGVGFAIALTMRWAGVRLPLSYVPAGVIVWFGMYQSGIHPTIAGVLLGLMTPVRPWFGKAGFAEMTQQHLTDLSEDRQQLLATLDQIKRARREAVSPAEMLVHELHPFVAFGVMPVFALANAGVVLGGADISAGDSWWLFLGVVCGLAVGKPIGILAASLAASGSGIATRSPEMQRRGILLVGMVGGIGFTMSLFIAQLAFPPGPLLDAAKLAILVGSGVAMVVGLLFGALICKKPPAARGDDSTADVVETGREDHAT